ncbi:WD40 repeat domain-containing protein [Nostoc sp.]|uniref:WD40 repeat domain-containing protein n=1 Tax=Nostoc sp. TaxID=1180 RepID=UPI002FF6E56B
MDITLVINAIKAIIPATASLAIQQAQSNEYVIKSLQKLGLAKIQPGGKFEEVYANALVEYDPESTLNFLRKKEIKEAFWKAFVSSNNEEWNILKAQAEKENIDFAKVEKFREIFISVANRSINPQQVIADAQIQEQLKTLTEARANEQLREPPEQSPYPDEFKALIEEKTKAFCGRVFVFNEFEDFLKNYPKGYFTVIGDAGMGKSAIAAQYVSQYKAICYFNIRAQGLNTPDQFLQSIRQQLINRYPLQNVENDNLPTLLEKVNKKLAADECLVIVVDALDEVEQPGSGNLLYLPKNLPERIYDNTLKLWNLETGEDERTFEGHSGCVNAVALTADGKRVISASNDRTLKVWNLQTGEAITTFTGEAPFVCCTVAPDGVTPDGVTIVVGESSGKVHFLPLENVE